MRSIDEVYMRLSSGKDIKSVDSPLEMTVEDYKIWLRLGWLAWDGGFKTSATIAFHDALCDAWPGARDSAIMNMAMELSTKEREAKAKRREFLELPSWRNK